MRTITFLSLVLLLSTVANSQTIATFDDLTLPNSDTFYVNYTASGTDVGFTDGLAHFPCFYDTAFGGYWGSGFAYSNKHDSVTSGSVNQYSAKTAIGYAGSAKYLVAYGTQNKITLMGAALGKSVDGFYITNNTYAYNSMKNGDAFAKKFGDTTGNAPDWFKLVIRAYSGGTLKPDSVEFYLADYRFVNNDSDYIVRTWDWVNLLPLGHTDSLQLSLSSSDTGSFGMNTPAYFCLDNFTTNETSVSVQNLEPISFTSIYPNPATNFICLNFNNSTVYKNIIISDISGKIISSFNSQNNIVNFNIHDIPSGLYFVTIFKGTTSERLQFIKQ